MKSMIRSMSMVLIALFAISASASAHNWAPNGPVKLLIGFAAGGGADTQARLIAQDIEEAVGWEIIPEQITGKGGLNLAMALKDEPQDGTVIGMVATETLGYNLRAADVGVGPNDFTAIATTAGFQMGIVAKSDMGWKDFGDVVDAAKSGRAIRFGTMSPRLSDLAYLLGKAQGIELNIVEVKGGKAVMNGVNGGDMDLGFMAGIQAKGVAAGDLVNLASALSVPLKQTPNAPLMKDYGLEFNSDGYFVFIGPGGMDKEVRDTWIAAISNAVKKEGSRSNGMISKAFGGPTVISGDTLQAQIVKEFEDAGRLMAVASQ
ncbi:Bug family tripartite tricarboxylate transporter substrate binding protein [Thioalkalivibrio sp. HK1]|uniref:Bug family tripartite tricarboxylate transporter substrate binding protein n=1 Tax=Thioalkalivibrio sp. HK1 TaxID=1469245 RepID=UPI0018CC02FF|nr:tripartite tricarboxylate transporter substrate-binding protein [Thioalkalivibrio sp. HK1]